MRKNFFVLLILILMMTGCSSEGQYKNEEYMFSLTYDNEWTEVTPPEGILCKIEYNARRNDDGSAIGEIEIMAKKTTAEETLDNVATYYVSALKDGQTTYTKAILDGLDGYWITVKELEGYTSKEDIEDTTEKVLVVTKNDENAYAFFISADDESKFGEIEDKADNILAGFKVMQ